MDDAFVFQMLLQNADAVISGVEPNELTGHQTRRYRDIMLTRIHDTLKSSKCASANCRESSDVVQWVLCDNCMLWHCERPTSLWYCRSCIAAGCRT